MPWNRTNAESLQARIVQAKQFRSAGLNNRAIGKMMGFSMHYVSRLINGRVEPSSWVAVGNMARPPKYEVAHRNSAHAIGRIGEWLVAAELLRRGFDVWQPMLADRSDWAVSFDRRFVRVQVKTATVHQQRNAYRVGIHSPGRRRRYENLDFEFFVVCCLGTSDFYVLPMAIGMQSKGKWLDFFPHRDKAMKNRGFDLEEYKNAFDLLKSAPNLA